MLRESGARPAFLPTGRRTTAPGPADGFVRWHAVRVQGWLGKRRAGLRKKEASGRWTGMGHCRPAQGGIRHAAGRPPGPWG